MDEMLKQAKLKALRLLTDMDRTETQLRQKLRLKDYPEEIVEATIAYVKSFGYVNDANYAKRFVETKKESKSCYEISGALSQRGIERALIEQAIEECYSQEDEERAIMLLAKKKRFSFQESTEIDKKKFCNYLLRKGFHYEAIRKVIEVSSWNA